LWSEGPAAATAAFFGFGGIEIYSWPGPAAKIVSPSSSFSRGCPSWQAPKEGFYLGTDTRESMTTTAQNVKYRRQLAKLEASRRNPDKVKMLPRERIRVQRRCQLCGRARAVFRKFGICRICFRNLASNGLIPGVRKASW
jgi:small subunit ribosomal protein S14